MEYTTSGYRKERRVKNLKKNESLRIDTFY